MLLTLAHHVPRSQQDMDLSLLVADVAQGVYGKSAPPIYVLEAEDPSRGLIRGRYFPSAGIALVLRHEDDTITAATAFHETAHYLVYKRRCGCYHGSRKCGYVGHHDAGFRRTVAALYDRAGVPDYAREAVEGTIEA